MKLFSQPNYKKPITNWLNSSLMSSGNCVINTSAGLNLLREDIVDLDWTRAIHISERPQLQSATNQRDEAVGTVMLYIRVWEARVKVVFWIVKNLVVPVLLKTSFIDRFVEGILLLEKKIVPYSSQPISFLTIHETQNDDKARKMGTSKNDSKLLAVLEERQERVVHVARATKLQSMSETSVLVKKRRWALQESSYIRCSDKNIL